MKHFTIDIFSMALIISGHDWEDPDDPTVIAENELMGAANSIDAAARKLMALRPRRVEQKVKFSCSYICTHQITFVNVIVYFIFMLYRLLIYILRNI